MALGRLFQTSIPPNSKQVSSINHRPIDKTTGLQFLDLNIFPQHLDAAARMDLQRYGTFPCTYFGVGNGHHFDSVEPGSKCIPDQFDLHFVPFPFLEHFFLFRSRLNKPSPTIGFIYSSSVVAGRGNFYLPSAYFGAIHGGSDEYPAIAIGLLLKLQGKLKIFVRFVGGQITVLFVRATFADQ